jgi:RND family efflux transporter MFP subunit
MADDDLSKLRIDRTESIARPRKRKLVLSAGLALLCAALALVLYVTGLIAPPIEVEVVSATLTYPSQGLTLLNASGYVVAQRRAAVASKVTARLVSLSVEEGSRVRAGQIIARLESDDVSALREQAEANLRVAKANLEQAKAELRDATLSFSRNSDLIAQGFVSQAEYDASEARHHRAEAGVAGAEASVKVAEAALRNALVSIEYTFIRAPFDAVVLTKNADIGDIVTPLGAAANAKAAVVTIADMDSLQVEVDVSESNLSLVRMGQPCEIQLDALPDVRFRGVVHMIVPTADRTKATVMVKVRFLDRDSRVLPEMSAKVAFLSRPVAAGEQRPKTSVNPAVVADRRGKSIVFRLENDRARLTAVTIGEPLGDLVEVTEGLKAGDRVVLRPLGRMKDGLRVKAAEK